MAEKERALIDTHGDHDLVALMQLGAAAILAWPLLDADMQRDLIVTAEAIEGVEQDPEFRDILTRLVRMNTRSGG